MTRKRYTKLLMSLGVPRNLANEAARLNNFSDQKSKFKRAVCNGIEYLAAGYAYHWVRMCETSPCFAAMLAERCKHKGATHD